jgi:hypothetical protein
VVGFKYARHSCIPLVLIFPYIELLTVHIPNYDRKNIPAIVDWLREAYLLGIKEAVLMDEFILPIASVITESDDTLL